MAVTATATPRTAGMRLLDRLLQEKGLEAGAYALFFVVGEGTFFAVPESTEPVEEASGFALLITGDVYSFWMEWDTELKRPVLSEWERVDPEPFWATAPEYQRARQRLGLPAA